MEFHPNKSTKYMRPAQLFTLSAAVGLWLISYGTSAQAVPVTFSGNVTSSCTVVTSDPVGPLSETPGEPATALQGFGTDRASVTVTCNNSAKSLKLEIDNTNSVVYNGVGKIRFNGITGVFAGTNNPVPNTLSQGPITVGIPAPTAAVGDLGRIQGRIEAPAGALLRAANNYKLVVNATIVP
jgi:hypothetical protein